MFCTKCGNEIKSDATFCTKCGNKIEISNTHSSVQTASTKKEQQISGISKKHILIVSVVAIILLVTVVLLFSKKDDQGIASNNALNNYNEYVGTWEYYGRISHPDGTLDTSSNNNCIYFDIDGIDCSQHLGNPNCQFPIDSLIYDSINGNDWYIFSANGMHYAFEYRKDEGNMVMYTPSENYPSDDWNNWNDRERFNKQ